MKKSIKISFGLGIVALAISAVLLLDVPVIYAVSNLTIQDGVNAARGSAQPTDLFGAYGVFTTITNTLLFVIGALSVVMIIIGGFRYVISGGNSTAVTSAKNTILYALVGLVVAFLAYAVVNFLLSTLSLNGVGGTNV